ncbi:MAG: N-acetyltransferase [Sphingobacteriaceae bacterium]|nr:MAG: N-acetyltransferase [Sphingobacteriaceae bacterium]
MELYGSGFLLREWRTGDEQSLFQSANNPKVSQYLENRFPSPYTAADAQFWVDTQIRQTEPLTNVALIIADEVAGGIEFILQNDIYCKSARIGYWLAEPYWGKGIMTEVLTVFTTYIFARFDVERIYAGIFSSNIASAKVLQKAGFQLEGTFKKALFKNGIYDDELIGCQMQLRFPVVLNLQPERFGIT